MQASPASVATSAELVLRDLDASPLYVRAVSVASRGPSDCRLVAEVDGATWERIEVGELFNFLREPQRERLATNFAAAPIRLCLRLRESIVDGIGADPASIVSTVAGLLPKVPTTPLARRLFATEAWVLIEALQLGADQLVGMRFGNRHTSAELAGAIGPWVTRHGGEVVDGDDGPQTLVTLALPIGDDEVEITAVIDAERGWAAAVTIIASGAPDRADLALALMAINYDVGVGAFELDPRDGELRLRTSIELGPHGLTPLALAWLLEGHTRTLQSQLSRVLALFRT